MIGTVKASATPGSTGRRRAVRSATKSWFTTAAERNTPTFGDMWLSRQSWEAIGDKAGWRNAVADELVRLRAARDRALAVIKELNDLPGYDWAVRVKEALTKP